MQTENLKPEKLFHIEQSNKAKERTNEGTNERTNERRTMLSVYGTKTFLADCRSFVVVVTITDFTAHPTPPTRPLAHARRLQTPECWGWTP